MIDHYVAKYGPCCKPGTPAWKIDLCYYNVKADRPITPYAEHIGAGSTPQGVELLRLFLSDECGGLEVAQARAKVLYFLRPPTQGVVLHRSPAMEIHLRRAVRSEECVLMSWLNCELAVPGARARRAEDQAEVELLGSFGGDGNPVGKPRELTYIYRVQEVDKLFRRAEFHGRLNSLATSSHRRSPSFPRLMIGYVRNNKLTSEHSNG